MIFATNHDEIRHAYASHDQLVVTSGGTKSALSANANLSLEEMCGVMQYEPSEYTFTALAGTTLSQIREMLAEHNQFMPFDPPFVEAGGTLGGTVAAGLSGSGRYRFGGVRDFLLGVEMVTSSGRLVFGGGKVVKNAAGFDIPKLMVGALGEFGVMTELTFKVFPRPESYRSLKIEHESFAKAVANMNRLAGQPLDFTCIDLSPDDNSIIVRVGGITESANHRLDRVRVLARTYDNTCRPISIDEEGEENYWADVNEFRWLPADARLIKLPITPSQLENVESALSEFGDIVKRRYCVGGNLVWIGWPTSIPMVKLNGVCSQLGRQPLVLTGSNGDVATTRNRTEFESRLVKGFRT